MKEVQVHMIGLDANGEIIGFAFYPSLIVPANGELPEEIWYTK